MSDDATDPTVDALTQSLNTPVATDNPKKALSDKKRAQLEAARLKLKAKRDAKVLKVSPGPAEDLTAKHDEIRGLIRAQVDEYLKTKAAPEPRPRPEPRPKTEAKIEARPEPPRMSKEDLLLSILRGR